MRNLIKKRQRGKWRGWQQPTLLCMYIHTYKEKEKEQKLWRSLKSRAGKLVTEDMEMADQLSDFFSSVRYLFTRENLQDQPIL